MGTSFFNDARCLGSPFDPYVDAGSGTQPLLEMIKSTSPTTPLRTAWLRTSWIYPRSLLLRERLVLARLLLRLHTRPVTWDFFSQVTRRRCSGLSKNFPILSDDSTISPFYGLEVKFSKIKKRKDPFPEEKCFLTVLFWKGIRNYLQRGCFQTHFRSAKFTDVL